MPRNYRPTVDRFAEKIALTETGCIEWLAAINEAGYGIFFTYGPQRTWRAHRWSYEYHVGLIPKGLVLDHLCRNRACVNPEHLEPVTDAQNILRGVSPAAHHAVLTHCPAGHPYSGANLYVDPAGWRHCRECKRARDRQRYYQRKAA